LPEVENVAVVFDRDSIASTIVISLKVSLVRKSRLKVIFSQMAAKRGVTIDVRYNFRFNKGTEI
jgi:hypothetical protein